MSQFDRQVGGDHYKKMPIQPLEFIAKNNLDFFQGCVIKYILRYKDKNGVEDLKKAIHFIEMMIEMEEERLRVSDAEVKLRRMGLIKDKNET